MRSRTAEKPRCRLKREIRAEAITASNVRLTDTMIDTKHLNFRWWLGHLAPSRWREVLAVHSVDERVGCAFGGKLYLIENCDRLTFDAYT